MSGRGSDQRAGRDGPRVAQNPGRKERESGTRPDCFLQGRSRAAGPSALLGFTPTARHTGKPEAAGTPTLVLPGSNGTGFAAGHRAVSPRSPPAASVIRRLLLLWQEPALGFPGQVCGDRPVSPSCSPAPQQSPPLGFQGVRGTTVAPAGVKKGEPGRGSSVGEGGACAREQRVPAAWTVRPVCPEGPQARPSCGCRGSGLGEEPPGAQRSC